MILNLTPHTIVLRTGPRDVDFRISSSGEARVESTTGAIRSSRILHTEDDGSGTGDQVHHVIPVHAPPVFGAIVGLPETVEPGTLIVVSAVVGEAARREAANNLSDRVSGAHAAAARLRILRALVTPGTGPRDGAIREAGQVVAVTRLVSVL